MSETLYKYYPASRASVLENLMVRFTPLDQLNDPMEGRFILGPAESEAARAVEDSYRAEWAQVEILISSQMGVLGVLCLSKNPGSVPMWAHYASEGRGFLLGIRRDLRPFDGRAFIWSEYRTEIDLRNEPGFGSFCDVEYHDEPFSIAFGDDVPWRAFFTKRTEWGYEQEVRIFRTLADADVVVPAKPRDINLFKVPAHSVASVIVGWSADSEVLRAAQQLQQREDMRHILFQQAVVDHRNQRVRYEPLPIQAG